MSTVLLASYDKSLPTTPPRPVTSHQSARRPSTPKLCSGVLVLPEIAEEPFRPWRLDGVGHHLEGRQNLGSNVVRLPPPSLPRGTRFGSLDVPRCTSSFEVIDRNDGPLSTHTSAMAVHPPKSYFADSSSEEEESELPTRKHLGLARRLLKTKHSGASPASSSRRARRSSCDDAEQTTSEDITFMEPFLSMTAPSATPSKAAKLLGMSTVLSPSSASSAFNDTPKLTRSPSASPASTASPPTPKGRSLSTDLQNSPTLHRSCKEVDMLHITAIPDKSSSAVGLGLSHLGGFESSSRSNLARESSLTKQPSRTLKPRIDQQAHLSRAASQRHPYQASKLSAHRSAPLIKAEHPVQHRMVRSYSDAPLPPLPSQDEGIGGSSTTLHYDRSRRPKLNPIATSHSETLTAQRPLPSPLQESSFTRADTAPGRLTTSVEKTRTGEIDPAILTLQRAAAAAGAPILISHFASKPETHPSPCSDPFQHDTVPSIPTQIGHSDTSTTKPPHLFTSPPSKSLSPSVNPAVACCPQVSRNRSSGSLPAQKPAPQNPLPAIPPKGGEKRSRPAGALGRPSRSSKDELAPGKVGMSNSPSPLAYTVKRQGWSGSLSHEMQNRELSMEDVNLALDFCGRQTLQVGAEVLCGRSGEEREGTLPAWLRGQICEYFGGENGEAEDGVGDFLLVQPLHTRSVHRENPVFSFRQQSKIPCSFTSKIEEGDDGHSRGGSKITERGEQPTARDPFFSALLSAVATSLDEGVMPPSFPSRSEDVNFGESDDLNVGATSITIAPARSSNVRQEGGRSVSFSTLDSGQEQERERERDREQENDPLLRDPLKQLLSHLRAEATSTGPSDRTLTLHVQVMASPKEDEDSQGCPVLPSSILAKRSNPSGETSKPFLYTEERSRYPLGSGGREGDVKYKRKGMTWLRDQVVAREVFRTRNQHQEEKGEEEEEEEGESDIDPICLPSSCPSSSSAPFLARC